MNWFRDRKQDVREDREEKFENLYKQAIDKILNDKLYTTYVKSGNKYKIKEGDLMKLSGLENNELENEKVHTYKCNILRKAIINLKKSGKYKQYKIKYSMSKFNLEDEDGDFIKRPCQLIIKEKKKKID